MAAIFHLGPHDPDRNERDSPWETSDRGIWAIKISFIGLMITALTQVVIVHFSGSVALLADTIHNFGDASTAIPLWLAFALAKRRPTRRYTYGYGRAEDLAGAAVVALILISAAVAGYQAIERLMHPRPVAYIEWIAAAAVIGFIGNEAIAVYRTRVGREIGSAALVADGQHARIDGLTSLAVLGGALGFWLGFPLADPIIGLIITLAILRIAWNAARSMWYRIMDAVDPEVYATIEAVAGAAEGVKGLHQIRARWIGHQLEASLHLEVYPETSLRQAHQISENVQHALFHALPRLEDISVHLDPVDDREDFHLVTQHHRQRSAAMH